MHRAAAEVMRIEDVTYGERENPLRVRGELLVPAEEALARLRPRFEAVGHTPMLRHENNVDEIRALPMVFQKAARRFPVAAVILFAVTVVSVFFVGLLWASDETGPGVVVTAAQYTLALLGILGAHEMGHYVVARHYRVHTSPPFFIPMPLSILGTMGAVIAMREPAPNRRIQFDIGVAGPLAGLVIAVPVLLLGLSMSEVQSRAEILAEIPGAEEGVPVLQEGNSLAYLAAKYLVFGEVLPQGDRDVWIHPIAFAGWAGLLVTALNLIPIGQLDGGHVMYGLFGHKAAAFRTPVIIALFLLAISGTLRDAVGQAPLDLDPGLLSLLSQLPGWAGWWIWLLLAYFLLRRHAPVLDEITGLDGKRKALAVAMLVIFILIFTPTPLMEFVIRPADAALGVLRWLM
jgi:membrane-associated protease RseP (regulator of RpoE activity)